MKTRRILQVLALAAIAAGIFVMRPDSLDQHNAEPAGSEAPEVVESMKEDLRKEAVAAVASAIEPAMPTPALSSTGVMTKELPGEPDFPPVMLQKGELPWEKRVNDVLDNSKISDSNKARLLFEMLPGLPVEGRESTAEHAITRLDDADYRHAQNVITNPATYPPALAVLWGDLMGRPEAISLPILLQVARNPSHPYAEHALENLDLLLGQNFAADWPRWETAIREKLAKETKR